MGEAAAPGAADGSASGDAAGVPCGGARGGDDEEGRWRALWARLLARFEEEAGDPPGEDLEAWERSLLARLLSEELPAPGAPAAPAAARRPGRGRAAGRRGGPFELSGRSLAACEKQSRQRARTAWASEAAEASLVSAAPLERAGELAGARAALERALDLGPPRPVDAGLRLAHLLRVIGPAAGGGLAACEARLRQTLAAAEDAAASAPKARRPNSAAERRLALARLALLLCQEGREEEALPLLRRGGWTLRLAPWVLRYAAAPEKSVGAPPAASPPPLRVFDGAIPGALMGHLREVLAPGSVFWREHGYSEVLGSGENGYFSYVRGLDGPALSTLDLLIRHVLRVASAHFPELEEATVAEWWAHCRPHPCGHQLHFDSDNEGIGGARHPICSCVLYVEAAPGFGGPTLVTDQRLSDGLAATGGWLVHPEQGRLAVYDGSVLHGVMPGHGEAPGGVPPDQRRITSMVAFWRQIRTRPWGPDGLAGSSRPMPDPAAPLAAGTRCYTWHQRLALDEATRAVAEAVAAAATEPGPAPTAVPPLPGDVWVPVEAPQEAAPADAAGGKPLPGYEECFQF